MTNHLACGFCGGTRVHTRTAADGTKGYDCLQCGICTWDSGLATRAQPAGSAATCDEGAAQKPKLTDEAARKWRELDGEYQEWLNRGR